MYRPYRCCEMICLVMLLHDNNSDSPYLGQLIDCKHTQPIGNLFSSVSLEDTFYVSQNISQKYTELSKSPFKAFGVMPVSCGLTTRILSGKYAY